MAISRAWAFQRSVVRKVYNREIYDWFKDLPADALPSNIGGRVAARSACVIGAQDSIQTVILKIQLFERIKQSITLLPKVTGTTYPDIDESYEHRPLITLYFLQDLDSVPDGFRAVPGRISFRLVGENSDTITETKLKEIAREIKNQFALGGGVIWEKGKNMVVYRDVKNGLKLQVLCRSEANGVDIVQRVCNVIDKPYDADKKQYNEPSRPSSTSPVGTDLILGKRVKERRWRPTVNVRFLYATAKISGLENAVPLVDRSKQFFQAYEFI